MIFFNKKTIVGELIKLLKQNNKLEFIVKNNWIGECTGDTNQIDRETVRKEFKDGVKKILLCTDVLQRGMDFRKVRVIIHYGLPTTPAGEFKEERLLIIINIVISNDLVEQEEQKMKELLSHCY